MESLIRLVSIIAILTPLAGSLVSGIFGKKIGRAGAHWTTIIGVGVSVICSLLLIKWLVLDHVPAVNNNLYIWTLSGRFQFNVGILIDQLTALMMLTVSFVSLLVHIYSIGYMAEDTGYQRFFSYMSLFTFFMLILVAANNFLVLFFGWEGVGLVSYLLIGFWFQRESAAQGGFKAFLVNRVGDFGFILGLAAIMDYFGTLDYQTVFNHLSDVTNMTVHVFPALKNFQNVYWPAITTICVLLFIGAMGKSAQIPLQVWLPESMEGPTPISALIHAATMVTAGVYMVVRLSPLYELSPSALSLVMIVGATGALFMGLIAIVQNDIKRVIAYSTMSQLGYMMAGAGASAYSAAMFHLMTHACFKALLFLTAGSVIIGLHHEQDLRKMGNLRKYMPITYVTFLIGSLALVAIPPFSGFYSKDAIIDAVHLSTRSGANFAYICLLMGTFVTALYTFRAFFMAFHTKERFDVSHPPHESPKVVTMPLIILAIPSVLLGIWLVSSILSQTNNLLGTTLTGGSYALAGEETHTLWQLTIYAVTQPPFWFALAGIFFAWLFYIRFPQWPAKIAKRFHLLYEILVHKYGFDALYQLVFVRGSLAMSNFFYKVADVKLLDGFVVNGSGRGINKISQWLRRLQSGYLYHYAFAMILGLFIFLGWLVWKKIY